MNVAELIVFLQTQQQDLPCVVQMYSEQYLFDTNEIHIKHLCEPRPDGWVHDERPDMPTMKYLVFPGN